MTNFVQTFVSPAKLNLFLEVKGRRDDGFHELETVMVRTSLCDEIKVATGTDNNSSLTVTGNSGLASRVPTDASNLILQAADAFQAAAGFNTGWNIQLQKVIPIEAGLAGGSSNAATTLLALNQLTGQPLQKDGLHEIAASLGSDINFFVEDCTAAVCTGRGEEVDSFQMTKTFYFVVARPSKGNSTPAVFRQLTHQSELNSAADVVSALQSGSIEDLEAAIFNRLLVPACELNGDMADLIKQMEATCQRPVAMSGSGSTCFVCCEDEADAAETLQNVLSLQPQFAMAVQTV